MRETLDVRVGARKDQADSAVVGPRDEVGRSTVSAVHLQYLCVLVGLTSVMTFHDQTIPHLSLHLLTPLLV